MGQLTKAWGWKGREDCSIWRNWQGQSSEAGQSISTVQERGAREAGVGDGQRGGEAVGSLGGAWEPMVRCPCSVEEEIRASFPSNGRGHITHLTFVRGEWQ